MKKQKRIGIRVTEQQHAQITQRAKEYGYKSLSEFVLTMALGKESVITNNKECTNKPGTFIESTLPEKDNPAPSKIVAVKAESKGIDPRPKSGPAYSFLQ